ncbi:telomere repeat-binding factor 4-like [Silene latifolia]|uniref:telomere repeat-binding factor 4-like n=1 Tax=Silene latifolia TaxID=37657 RepID=UPI003D777FD0
MGNPKQKWKAEEEEALRDGIAKHGVGKWKFILQDPDFRILLKNRTNIDLKDKYRNMVAAVQGTSTRTRTPKPKVTQDAPATPAPLVNIQPSPVIPIAREPVFNHVKEEAVTSISDALNGSRCNTDTIEMIFEALSAAKEQKGMDIGSIVSYIEQRIEIEAPQNFRKQTGARLRRLVQQGRIEKVESCYRLKNTSLAETNPRTQKDMWSRLPLIPVHVKMGESLEEAAKTAAYKVAEAEEKTYFAVLCVREAERLSRLQEEADSVLQLAQELYDGCRSNNVLLVA